MDALLDRLVKDKTVRFTAQRADVKHLLSAERAARGSFYATRVGFVAINPKGQRIARAHNGFPKGVAETRERWNKSQKDFYHLHAECAGVFHAARMGYACQNATAYITHPPCPGCAKVLAASGFSRVVFSEQALLERADWKEDTEAALQILREGRVAIYLYRDRERGLKHADVTRTEVDLKKVYDALVPEARWSSTLSSDISRAAKPESAAWAEQPVVRTLLAAARQGMALAGKGVVMDFPPECRAATAMIQAGLTHSVVRERLADTVDPRWSVPLELERASTILGQDAGISLTYAQDEKGGLAALLQAGRAPCYLDATREGLARELGGGLALIRPVL